MAGYWGNAAYARLPHFRPSRMAEIGVDRGHSSGWMLARCPDLYLYMIDPWTVYQDSPQPDTRRSAAACENAHKMARSITRFADDRRRVLRHDSVKASRLHEEDGTPVIPDESLDIAFVDGNHTRAGVLRDMDAYWRKVRYGGFLAGHDWEPKPPRKYGVNDAVTEWCERHGLTYELDEDASWWIRKTTEVQGSMTLADYVRLIETGEPFAQAGYGDGEWACLLGLEGENCDGTVYAPELGAALRETLLGNRGVWCATNPGQTELRYRAEDWITEHGLRVTVPWVPKETLSDANVRGQLAPFLAAVRKREPIVVGPYHLKDLPRGLIADSGRIYVPDRTAWRHAPDIAWRLRQYDLGGALVLFAAGMASNLIIHEIWPEAAARGATLLDIGAILDPYAGVLSRNGYRRPEFQDAIRRNLEAT